MSLAEWCGVGVVVVMTLFYGWCVAEPLLRRREHAD